MLQQEQPYERFLTHGPSALTNAELLALILRTGAAGQSAVDLAKQILSEKGNGTDSLLALHRLTMGDLLSIKGIGEVKAVKILCLSEIARRLSREQREEGVLFTDPAAVAAYYMEDLRHLTIEKTLLVFLDARMRRIGEEILSVGTAGRAPVSVREIFRRCLEKGCSSLILLHNHPSGDPYPSEQDILITRKIREAGALMEIPLADHIVIGDLRYFSMKQQGVLC